MNIHPHPYSIPDEYIVADIPVKKRVFSEMIPGGPVNYAYGPGQEDAYVEQYRSSRFAYTSRKGGWDCLRHYEILAAGCIPVFRDLSECPANTMVSFPKELVLEACAKLLPWDDSKIELYEMYVRRLLKHCRENCSVSAGAARFLRAFPDPRRVLMIQCHSGENYTRELLSIGLRRKLGENFIDYPRIDVLYKDCDLSRKYGNGFTYGGRLSPIELDRTHIEERIRAKEFDIVIYGKVGRDEGWEGLIPTMPFWDVVSSVYSREQIAFLYGGDCCQNLKDISNPYTRHLLEHAPAAVCFVRELR